MKLITVKEYATIEKISEQGARKRVSSGLVQSVQLDNNTYIIIIDTSLQIIKDFKQKIKLLNANIRTYKEKVSALQYREDYVKRLEDRVDKLERSLEASTEKKEELYEKVITTVMLPKGK